MTTWNSIDVSSRPGFIELLADGLCLELKENDAKNLHQWLGLAVEDSISFLLRIDGQAFSLEGRNYQSYLDFLIYVEEDTGFSARTFTIPKSNIECISNKLRKVIAETFDSAVAKNNYSGS